MQAKNVLHMHRKQVLKSTIFRGVSEFSASSDSFFLFGFDLSADSLVEVS